MGNKKTKLRKKNSAARAVAFDCYSRSELKLKKTKDQARSVWTSYGIGIALLSYLTDIESSHLQRLNKFAYNILVSRVLTKLRVCFDHIFFTRPFVNENSIMCYDRGTLKSIPIDVDSSLEPLKLCAECQVSTDKVFQYNSWAKELRVLVLSQDKSKANKVRFVPKDLNPFDRVCANEMLNFKDEFLFT